MWVFLSMRCKETIIVDVTNNTAVDDPGGKKKKQEPALYGTADFAQALTCA